MSSSARSRVGTTLSTRTSPVSSKTRRIWLLRLTTTSRPPLRSMRRIDAVSAPRPEESRKDACERSTTTQHCPFSRQRLSRCSREGAFQRSRSPVTETTTTVPSSTPSSVRVNGFRTHSRSWHTGAHGGGLPTTLPKFMLKAAPVETDGDRVALHRTWILCLLVGALAALGPLSGIAKASRGLEVAIEDEDAFVDQKIGSRLQGFQVATAINATRMRILVQWSRVSDASAGTASTDPDYNWAPIDDAIDIAALNGMRVQL